VNRLIRTLAFTKDLKLKHDLPLEQLSSPEIIWYWADFNVPSEEEVKLLDLHFHFHPLAIEDCIHFLQRPKLDYYDGYHFFVLHALNQKTLTPEEMDMFVGNNYLITFHLTELREVEEVWQRASTNEKVWKKGSINIVYLLMDKIVDQYFPSAYQIEDHLNELNNNTNEQPTRTLIDQVFDIRRDLLKLRRIIVSMRDLLYRILNSERLEGFKEYKVYFSDIYDHLLRLTEMIESSRDITSDMRDSYISLNSNRMNKIMMTLTIISSIFIPLTFVAGVYGMNFEYMPELKWKYGYFLLLGIMTVIGISMYLWFRRKGWFYQ
jgi:magnesium transporter